MLKDDLAGHETFCNPFKICQFSLQWLVNQDIHVAFLHSNHR